MSSVPASTLAAKSVACSPSAASLNVAAGAPSRCVLFFGTGGLGRSASGTDLPLPPLPAVVEGDALPSIQPPRAHARRVRLRGATCHGSALGNPTTALARASHRLGRGLARAARPLLRRPALGCLHGTPRDRRVLPRAARAARMVARNRSTAQPRLSRQRKCGQRPPTPRDRSCARPTRPRACHTILRAV